MSQFNLYEFLDFGSLEDYERLNFPAPEKDNGRILADPVILRELANRAFTEIAYRYPCGHLEELAKILKDKAAAEAEKFVAASLLRNAAIAAEGFYPMCQDTGTALIYGWRGNGLVGGTADEAAWLAKGASEAYTRNVLRNSQLGPLTMLEEKNTGDNLPAGVDIRSVPGNEYRFLFAAKGGGSTSRLSLNMESPSLLKEDRLKTVVAERIQKLGAAGCPPYTIGMVLGGTSPSQTMYALELAVYGLLDKLPTVEMERAATIFADLLPDGKSPGKTSVFAQQGFLPGMGIRSIEWEEILYEMGVQTGIGAQWGGRHLALKTRAIRLSRHAANLPLAIGISCSAHRKARAVMNEQGWFLEKLESDPARFLPASMEVLPGAYEIDLDTDQEKWLEKLRSLSAGTPVLLSGTVTIARDAAHARLETMAKSGVPIPDYFREHPIFYAGPTEPLPGRSSGSFGPTTASRMDNYLEFFMEKGASLVTIAKGNRSNEAQHAIRKARGVYLAAIGGAAALTAREHVLESQIVDFADLGMEAVRLVRVVRLPAIVVIDASGHSLYA